MENRREEMKKMMAKKFKREKQVQERDKELKLGKDWTQEQKVQLVQSNLERKK